MNIEMQLSVVGRAWTRASRRERQAAATAKHVIAAAAAAGVPETRIAELVGRDRMTVRRALGKL